MIELKEAHVVSRAYRLKKADGLLELRRARDSHGKPLLWETGLRVQVGEETAYVFEEMILPVRLCWVHNSDGSITATGLYIRSSAVEIFATKAA